jgi:DEAD/DEAH box helicase domain-containing protein
VVVLVYAKILYLFRLLAATPSTEDPVTILQAAGRDHIPVNTSWEAEDDSNDPKEVPSPEHRPTIDAVIGELQERRWYKGQIVMRKVTDELKACKGKLTSWS